MSGETFIRRQDVYGHLTPEELEERVNTLRTEILTAAYDLFPGGYNLDVTHTLKDDGSLELKVIFT